MRHRRAVGARPRPRRAPRPGRGHARRHALPRPRRHRGVAGRGHHARADAAGHRRPAGAAAGLLQRGREPAHGGERRDLQPPRAAHAARARAATASSPAPTPWSCRTSTRSTGSTSPPASTACSPWRCGTCGRAAWCWRATAPARSRSSTPRAAGSPAASPSPPSPGRWRACRGCGASRRPGRSRATSRTASSPASDCAFADLRQLPPAHLLEVTEAGARPVRYWRPWDGLQPRGAHGRRRAGRGHARDAGRGGRVAHARRRALRRLPLGRRGLGPGRHAGGAARRTASPSSACGSPARATTRPATRGRWRRRSAPTTTRRSWTTPTAPRPSSCSPRAWTSRSATRACCPPGRWPGWRASTCRWC